MTSVINHIASCSEIALEGSLIYIKELHSVNEYAVTFKADIKQNYCTFELLFYKQGQDTISIKTDTIYSYNTADMAKATVEFLLCQLLYRVMNDPMTWDDLELIKELQYKFELAFEGVKIAII